MSGVVDFAEQIVLSPAELLAALSEHEQQAALLALATRRLEASGEWAFDGSVGLSTICSAKSTTPLMSSTIHTFVHENNP